VRPSEGSVSSLAKSSRNVTLQASAYTLKFALLIALARFLSLDGLGVYGIIATTVGLFIYLAGLDVYNFTNREVPRLQPVEVAALVRDQFALHSAAYLFALPLLIMLSATGFLPAEYALITGVLAVLEHVAQELYRLLVVLSKPIAASTALLIRTGLWVPIVIGVMAAVPSCRTPLFVCVMWAIASAASIAFSLGHVVTDRAAWRAGLATPIDIARLRAALKVGAVYLVGTASLRAIASADRYVLVVFWGNESVGLYTLYANIANAVPLLMETAVYMLWYPSLLAAWNGVDDRVFDLRMASLRDTAVKALLVVLLLAASVPLILPWFLRDPVFQANVSIYWILLIGASAGSLAMLPHLELYAKHQDWAISMTTVFACAVAVVLNIALVPIFREVGAAWATSTAMIVLAVSKAIVASQFNKRSARKHQVTTVA
jgi:O-antigen/teichoic acid export membrane protein